MRTKIISDAVSNISDQYIEEAADFYMRNKSVKKHIATGRAVAAAAVVVLVVVMSVPALAAANFEPAYNLLYTVSPTIAQKLKPVRMSCEDNGIKFDVISALVEGSEAKILVAVQDLEGDRIDETTDLFDSFSINTPFDCSSSCTNTGYDPETKTATFLIEISQWDQQDITGEKITVCVRKMLSNKQEYDDVLPELKPDQMETAGKTFVPAHISGGSGLAYDVYEKNFRSLVPDGDLASPVNGVTVTAAGYVDGKLHIQVRYDSILETDNHGYVYFKNSDGDIINCDANISYFTDEKQKESYSEYVFDLSDADLSEYVLYGHFVTSDTLITGSWSVTFPVESVSP